MKKIKFILLVFSKSLSRFYLKIVNRRNFIKIGNPSANRNLRISSSLKVNPLAEKMLESQKFRYLIITSLILIGVMVTGMVAWNSIQNNVLSEGVVGYYVGNNLPPVVTNLISQPLVSLDKSGRPQPQLVSGWQVNNNATLYIFKLKNNLLWSDGSVVKSSDIKFNLPDVEVSYPDESTIQFKLADSFYPFPGLLTAPVLKGNSLIGVGNYKVVRQEVSRNILTKLILSPINDPSLPKVVIRFYPDEPTARIAFQIGEVSSLIGISDAGELKDQQLVFFKKITNFNKIVAIFYNTKDASLSDKNFRKSLGYATPKIEDEIIARTSIFPNSWAYNDSVKDTTNNLELAKNYFEKVGKAGTITLTTTPLLSNLGERIIQSWKKVGISAVLRVESGIPQNFQALLIPQSIPLDPDQYVLWHSTQTKTNISQYDTNKRVDKDLEDGRRTGDVEKRREKYMDFQKVIAEDAPATFLYFPQNLIIYRLQVQGNLNKVLSLQMPQL